MSSANKATTTTELNLRLLMTTGLADSSTPQSHVRQVSLANLYID